MLRPLFISVHRDDASDVKPSQPAPADGDCVYCGGPLGILDEAEQSCAICTLVRHLERPRIDEEVRLVWLPEMSQGALVCLLREMHCRLRNAGERFDDDAGPAVVSPERSALHYARLALSSRSYVAAEHLGTSRPSELAYVLARMSRQSYDRRHRILGGLRVLPVGRFFVGAQDVYPAIVDSWCKLSRPVLPSISIRSAA